MENDFITDVVTSHNRQSVVSPWTVVGLQPSISAALLAPDSHIRRSGQGLAIPREREQANNTQEGDYPPIGFWQTLRGTIWR
jgi:hypothetical protein